MENSADERAVLLGRYIVSHSATVRSTAKANSISKSTVHSDITKRLKKIDGELYEKVRKILDINKSERHLRGGMATKEKWEKECRMQNVTPMGGNAAPSGNAKHWRLTEGEDTA